MYAAASAMIWTLLLFTFSFLGLAYIVWVLSIREIGITRVLGQVAAIAIFILAVIVFLYGLVGGISAVNRFGWMGMMGCPGMQGKGMMWGDDDKMEKMMRSPRMRREMERYMEEKGSGEDREMPEPVQPQRPPQPPQPRNR